MTIFDFAMSMESSAMKFYRKLADATENTGLKKIFSMMIRDEEALYRKFEQMREDAPKTLLKEGRSVFSATDLFMEKMKISRVLGSINDDVDAYRFIMAMEEKLFMMYEKAAEQESDPKLKQALLKIARAEHKEYDAIEKVMDFVNAPNEYLEWGEFSNLGEFHNFGRDEESRPIN